MLDVNIHCRGSRRPLHRQSRMETPPLARLARYVFIIGARVAPSTGKAGWRLPLSLALLAMYLL